MLVEPEATVAALLFVAGGIALGTASGLTPGLHANNFAIVLGSAAPYTIFVICELKLVRPATSGPSRLLI